MYALEESFRILRVTVEARLAASAVVAVTSARRDDGSTYVATGLARAFAESGQRALLLGAKGDDSVGEELGLRAIPRTASSPLGTVSRVDEQPNLYIASVSALRLDARSDRGLAATLARLRDEYRVIVIDADPVPESALAHELAGEADAVLLAVRLGRKPSSADRALMKMLGESKSNIIGVVPTNKRRRAPMPPGDTVITPVPELESLPRFSPRQLEVGR